MVLGVGRLREVGHRRREAANHLNVAHTYSAILLTMVRRTSYLSHMTGGNVDVRAFDYLLKRHGDS